MAGSWERVIGDVHWAMTDKGSDVEGRGMMKTACQSGISHMGMFKDGFDKCEDHRPDIRANFHACAAEDQGRLFAIGVSILPETG